VEHIEVINEPKENQTIKLTLQQRSVNTTRHASFSYHPSNNQGNNKPGYTPPSKLFQPTNNNSSYKVIHLICERN